MNHKQKLGYILLGAGIMAVGITIGQFITPDIEAQNSGVFDEIQCSKLTMVGKARKEAVVLTANEEGNRVRFDCIDGTKRRWDGAKNVSLRRENTD